MIPPDTEPAVAARMVALWRATAPAFKLQRAVDASAAIQELARAGVGDRHAEASEAERAAAFAFLALGAALARAAYARGVGAHEHGARMNHLEVVLAFVQAVEACGRRYVLGGSLASSVSGEPRATLDVDVMVDIDEASIACVVRALGADFYADEQSVARAVRERSSTNVVHLPSATKIDVFIMGAMSIETHQMERRRPIEVGTPPRRLYVYTPEDILLQKLRWFRLGRDVSERQWRDITGIVTVQGERLDRAYLRRSAEAIGVLDLLERAIGQVG